MIPNSAMMRRTSNRIRKTKRTYSPSLDEDTPSTSKRIREKSHYISLSIPTSLSSSSTKEVVDNKEHSNISWLHNSFWNFAAALRYPIVCEKIANDKVITLLSKELFRAIRHLITGAKHVMQQAERQKLLCDDLNTFIRMEGGKLLLGFLEDNTWQKIGDVFVPNDEILDLRHCSSSVKLETLNSSLAKSEGMEKKASSI